jgi:hypothetical protein
MRHANRKPKARPDSPESVIGRAQSHGHCSVNGKECVMRRLLTLAVLTLTMAATAGSPMCDSGCIANAEDRRPAVDMAQQQRHRIRHAADHTYPPPAGEQRGTLRGDFWTPNERDRVVPEDGSRSGFETIVPSR